MTNEPTDMNATSENLANDEITPEERQAKFEQVFSDSLGDYFMLAGLLLKISDKLVRYDVVSRKFMQSVHDEAPEEIRNAYRTDMDVFYRDIKMWLAQVLPTVEDGFAIMFPDDTAAYGGFVGSIMQTSTIANTALYIDSLDDVDTSEPREWIDTYGEQITQIEEGLKFTGAFERQVHDATVEIKQKIAEATEAGNGADVAMQYGDVPHECDKWRLIRQDILSKGILYTPAELEEGKNLNVVLTPTCAWRYQCQCPTCECKIRYTGQDGAV